MIVFGGTPPVNPAAALNASILAASARGGDTIKLTRGAYTLETAVLLRSGVVLDMNGSTFIAGFSPSVELADDPTNAMLKTPGAITGTVNTTLSARAKPQSLSITVSSAAGIVAGQYMEIVGTNANEEQLSEGANMVTCDYVRVSSSYASGTTIPLDWPTNVWHASGHTVKSVTDVAADFGVYNGVIKAAGGTLAVGVLARYARQFQLDGLTFEGFSRAAIDIDKGSFAWTVNNIRGRGEINSLVFVDGAHRGQATRMRTDPDGLRYHAEGVTRGILHVHNDSADVTFDDANLAHGSCAVWVKHGHNVRVTKVTATDFDPAEAYTRTIATGEQIGGSFFGIVQTGSTPIPWAAFVGSVTIERVTVDAPSTSLSALLYCFCVHDGYGEFTHISAVNRRAIPGIRGILCQDFFGALLHSTVSGINYGLVLSGAQPIGVVSDYQFSSLANSVDGNATIPLLISSDMSAPPGMSGIYLGGNSIGAIRFSAPSSSVPPGWVMEDVAVHSLHYEYLIPAVNKTGADLSQIGEIAELEPAAATIAGIPRIRVPSEQSRKMCVIATGPFDHHADGEVCMVAPLPQRCTLRLRAADTVQPGDLLDVDTDDAGNTKPAKVNNASTAPNARALGYKTSGAAEAFVKVTPG